MTGAYWWEREDLQLADQSLFFAGHKVSDLALQFGTPSFVYSAARMKSKLDSLHTALNAAGFQNNFKVHYAMKANRFAPLLTFIKQTGLSGIDCCSPREVEHAISCGFRPDEISFTATNLSTADVQTLMRYKGMHINCDSLSTVRRIAELDPGRDIGLRINPAMGVGYGQNDKLRYSGYNTTKFGIYEEQFEECLSLCRKYNLQVTKIHFHTGCGYLNEQLSEWRTVIEKCLGFIDRIETLHSVNIGGGLGVPHTEKDKPLDLQFWASILAEYFLPRSLKIEVEPGDFVVKDSGILLLDVTCREQKRDKMFIGVNAGFNIAIEPAMYGLNFEPVPVNVRQGEKEKVSIAGNINEALDVFCQEAYLPPLEEGDFLALINAGGYSSSMSSNHCMRGEFKEFLLFD